MKFYLKFTKDIFLTFLFVTLYSILNIAVLKYINDEILNLTSSNLKTILTFELILILFLIFAIISRAVITYLGHNFVYNIRLKIVKEILNAKFESINKIPKNKLLASLTSDIASLSIGFGSIPEALQGAFILISTLGYIAYLSPSIGVLVVLCLAVMIFISFYFMKRTYTYFSRYRLGENILYKNYSECIEGFRELSINALRTNNLLNNKFIPNAKDMRKNIIKANILISFVSNFLSAGMLGVIGLIFYISLTYEVVSLKSATTIAIAILFIRSPLIMTISSLPSLQKAKIALNNLNKLNLEQSKVQNAKFDFSNWKKITLKNVNFAYESGFKLENINMEFNRNSIVFITGKNGSGKSTLFLILSGLLLPKSGEIFIDDIKIDSENLQSYKENISAVFSDFYLFDEFLSDNFDALNLLLDRFLLKDKVEICGKKFSTNTLSTGQKKRLALINALLENRNLLLLDEWAANQDPNFQAIFYNEILPYLNSLGITIILISHDDRYFYAAQKIYEIKNGKIKV